MMIQRKYKIVSIDDALKKFEFAKRAQGMKEGYTAELRKLVGYLDLGLDDPIYLIDKKRMDDYKIKLQTMHISHATMNHYLVTWRVFLYYCMREGMLEEYKIHLFKYQEEKIKFYDTTDVIKLLKKPDDNCSFREARTYTIVCFILATGARASTVAELKLDDIDFINKEITYRHLKNKKLAIVPLSPSLAKALMWYIDEWDIQEWLFPDAFGNKLTTNGMRQGLMAYCKERDVQNKGLHALRHSFAREYIKNGGGAFQLQQLLTHSSLDMTRKYVRLFNDDLKNNFESYSPLDKLNPVHTKIKRK